MLLNVSRKPVSGILVILLSVFVAGCATTECPVACQQPLVVLLTDFGEKDHYVGALKGAIYTANPSARIESITHEISKFDIVEGAYTLAQAA